MDENVRSGWTGKIVKTTKPLKMVLNDQTKGMLGGLDTSGIQVSLSQPRYQPVTFKRSLYKFYNLRKQEPIVSFR